jgi:hypothetical protein
MMSPRGTANAFLQEIRSSPPVAAAAAAAEGGGGAAQPAIDAAAAAAAGAQPLAFSEVKKRADALGRASARHAIIAAGVAKSKNGVYLSHGKKYTAESLKEMETALRTAISALPGAVKASCKRTSNSALNAEERARRVDIHVARAREAAEAITTYLKQPSLCGPLVEKARHRIEASRKQSRVDVATPRAGCFYVSNQFVEFVRGGQFGNGLALFFPGISAKTHAISGASPAGAEQCLAAVTGELPPGTDVLNVLGVDRDVALKLADPRRLLTPLILSQFATSPLLMTIIARYIRVNNLRDENGRVRIDKNMKKWFGPGTNTHWIIKDASGKEVDLTPAEELANPDSKFHKCALERLTERGGAAAAAAAVAGAAPACDEHSFVRTLSIALASKFIVPVVPETVAPSVKNQTFARLAAGISLCLF